MLWRAIGLRVLLLSSNQKVNVMSETNLINTNGYFYQQYRQKNPHYSSATLECAESTLQDLMLHRTDGDHPGMLLGKVQSGKTRTFMTLMAVGFDNHYDIVFLLTKNSIALVNQTVTRVQDEFRAFVADNLVAVHDIMRAPTVFANAEFEETKFIFVVKKQKHNIRRLSKMIQTHEILQHKNILIIDDEADAATVGFSGTEGDERANIVAELISDLRNLSDKISLLQVTATPYSLYLQPRDIVVPNSPNFRPLRPSFSRLVPVPEDYVGGDTYFGPRARLIDVDEPTLESMIHVDVDVSEFNALKHSDGRKINDRNVLKTDVIKTYRSAIISFLVGGTILRIVRAQQGIPLQRSRFSFLIHTEQTRAAHRWQFKVTTLLLNQLKVAATNDPSWTQASFLREFDDVSASLKLAGHPIPLFETVYARCISSLTNGEYKLNIVNSETDVGALLDVSGQLALSVPFTIFIGGQAIDRGVTIANLIGFYYGRRPRTMQQDTVLQHSRMYGYRRAELPVTRFYTSAALRLSMAKMEEFDSFLRDCIENGGDQSIQFIRKSDDGRIIPCSPNKIRVSRTETVRASKRFLPIGFKTRRGHTVDVREVYRKIEAAINELGGFNRDEPLLIDLEKCEQLIRTIQETMYFPDKTSVFDWDSAVMVMRHLSNQTSDAMLKGKVLLWAAKDRNVKREAGARSHAVYVETPDSARTEGELARTHAIDTPILFLLGQRGEVAQGWNGDPFFWPVLRAQQNAPATIYAPEFVDVPVHEDGEDVADEDDDVIG